jgi:hypothetical protein
MNKISGIIAILLCLLSISEFVLFLIAALCNKSKRTVLFHGFCAIYLLGWAIILIILGGG